MDEKTIRVLRDMANAVVLGIQEARGDGARDEPDEPPVGSEGSAFPERVLLRSVFSQSATKPPNPTVDLVESVFSELVDIVESVFSELARALNEHLPENGKAKD